MSELGLIAFIVVGIISAYLRYSEYKDLDK